ncbi:MAG: hypothetical protein Q7T18_10710 [Sedimentisphaerales bacterium]|nr:hypothetical protein [Sedimentisphaerales bacterium]
MEKHRTMMEKKWKVLTLSESHTMDKDIIPIEGSKFKQVRKEITLKGYRRKRTAGEEAEYEFSEIKGLEVFIDENARSIRARAPGETALSKVVNDFDLPLYKSS